MSNGIQLAIIIVEKTGTCKVLQIKDYKEEDLYKKCGFKSATDFQKHNEWNVKLQQGKFVLTVYGKTTGRANTENKYDFPPPIDSTLFFGNCAIICHIKKDDGSLVLCNMTLEFWNKIYEKLFGGFEDLAATAAEDEEEEDELENVPKEKKTKHGYLKDGFVVDTDSNEDDESYDSDEDNDEDEEETEDTEETDDDKLIIEDIGSELSEEEYDYDESDDENA